MSEQNESHQEPVTNQTKTLPANALSTNGRGGVWLPIVLTSIGVGVLLSGIFTGAVGLFGDSGNVTVADGFREAGREAVRLIVFTVLFVIALTIYGWKTHRHVGNHFYSLLRCLAVVALLEAVRVVQIEPLYVRIPVISVLQFILVVVSMFGLFALTLRESVLFTIWCTVGAVLLWLGAHIGIWVS